MASPGGSEQVSASTLATTPVESGALPGLARLFAQETIDPCLAPYRCCQRQTAGRLTPA
jgi:hypothetical protein